MSWFLLGKDVMNLRQKELLDEAKKGRLAAQARRGRPGSQALPVQTLRRVQSSVRALRPRQGEEVGAVVPDVRDAKEPCWKC
jgi:hypothetical protein